MISGDGLGLSVPDICLIVEEKPRNNPQPGKLTRPEIDSCPLGERQLCYPLTTAVVFISIVVVVVVVGFYDTFYHLRSQRRFRHRA